MNKLVGYVPPYLEALGADGLPLPRTWMVVVDLLRVKGADHGPNGESGRCRMECPEPIDALMREKIHLESIAFGLLRWDTLRIASSKTGGPSGGGYPAGHRRGHGFG
ncbi:MAG: hypothetical protein QE276_08320 [Cyanobium sp. D14.bin.5]|nr:hypothetical protein [Cyanobium sp. D14.bin.5]